MESFKGGFFINKFFLKDIFCKKCAVNFKKTVVNC